ncbi:unnamed protein product [Prorocentrum cordatum]|uniref:Uncharacterized protein n=1 Tax=Prorocentrum cordatum TaxID=2364126 RepID=A0ABN9V741_9DINO|nr:unnamed protein product [Polarella glacialis]
MAFRPPWRSLARRCLRGARARGAAPQRGRAAVASSQEHEDLGPAAPRESAVAAVAALHDEGSRFRRELQGLAGRAGPGASEAIEAAGARFEDRLERALARGLASSLARGAPQPGADGRASDAELQAGDSSSSRSAPAATMAADGLEAVLRSAFRGLGCSTVAVLDRCRLGDRGVGAELPDGTWIQAWISGGRVLWVLPDVPALSELARDPELSGSVLAGLLQYGAGRTDSFFLTRQPLAVGYKFGPLHHEVLSSPAALGSKLEDTILLVQQQARIMALEGRVARAALPTGAPATNFALAAPPAAGALPAAAAPRGRAEEALPTEAVPAGQAEEAPEAPPVQAAPASASEVVASAPPAAAAPAGHVEAPEAPPVAATEAASAPPAAAALACRAGEATEALAAVEAVPEEAARTAPAEAVDGKAAAWFERVEGLYLDPHSAVSAFDEGPERCFEISVQDSPRRRVGMDFIRKSVMDFEHFAAHPAAYRAAAEARGYAMEVQAHDKGHRRLKITWTVEEGTAADDESAAEAEVAAPPRGGRRVGSDGKSLAFLELPGC